MRQVRDRGEDAVVRGGVERADLRTAGLPRRGDGRDRERIGFRQRGQHHVAVRRTASRTPRRRPIARCPRSDAPERTAADASPSAARAAAITSCLVLPASVTIVCGPRCGAIARNSAGYWATGAASSTRSVVASSAGPVAVERDEAVDDAEVRGFLEVDAPAADADDGAVAPGRFLRQRERSADQADADDDELVDACAAVFMTAASARRGVSRRARCRARRESGGFPSPVPIVTRSHSGSP